MFDEGIVLTFSRLVAAGEIVHRDFYSVYGPGMYYLIAFLFHVFGQSFLNARLAGLVMMACIGAGVFVLLDRTVRTTIAVPFAVVSLAWMAVIGMYLYPVYPCLVLMLAGSSLLLRPDAIRRPAILIGAGACSGLAAYFRYDTGFFILLAHCTAITLCIGSQPWIGARWRSWFSCCAIYGLGACIAFLPGAILYASLAPIAAFRADIIDYSLQYYGRMRGLPFPSPLSLFSIPDQSGVYVPIAALLLGLPVIVADWRANRSRTDMQEPLRMSPATLFGCLTAILYYKGIVRVSNLHMFLSILPALVLLGIAAERFKTTRRLLHLLNPAVLVAVLPVISAARPVVHGMVTAPSFFVAPWLIEQKAGPSGPSPASIQACLPGPRLAVAEEDAKYVLTARYLVDNSKPDDHILIGLDRHDKILVNPLSLYFMADRFPGTHWAAYDPGLQNRADIQVKMIRDLAQHEVRWIVRDASFDRLNEPNDSAKSSGVHLLDAYLEEHYRPVAEKDEVAVWLRDDIPAPDVRAEPLSCQMSKPLGRP